MFTDCNFFCTFSVVFNCRSLFNEAAYLAALHWLRSPFAIRDADSKQSKTKIYEKNHLLLQILAVIGRYGPHLMIVMIFVTQNNFLNGPGISDCLLGFYPDFFNLQMFSDIKQCYYWYFNNPDFDTFQSQSVSDSNILKLMKCHQQHPCWVWIWIVYL